MATQGRAHSERWPHPPARGAATLAPGLETYPRPELAGFVLGPAALMGLETALGVLALYLALVAGLVVLCAAAWRVTR